MSRGFGNAFDDDIKDDGKEEVIEKEVLSEEDTLTIEAIRKQLEEEYQAKTSKKSMEETHKRTTFLFRKDLARRLDKLSRGKRGYKTMFFNKAIETLLDEYEK